MPDPQITIYSSERYRLDWPGHIFPTQKYDGVRERLLSLHPGVSARIQEPRAAATDELLLVHPESYLRRLETFFETPELGMLEFEIPLSKEVMETIRRHAGGSILACRDAAGTGGASVNLGGGFHHAFAEHGEGFCVLNDVAVALRVAQRDGWIRTAAVIDCDLHQGNGTAHIFEGDDSVYTFSIHQENNYPVKRRSDWDIGLEDGAGDDHYLACLEEAVPQILDAVRPDLVFYVAGADPYEDDLLGGLMLTVEGFRRRDRLIFTSCRERGLPVAVGLAGGYAQNADDVIAIHTNMVLDLFGAMGAPLE